MRAIRVAKNNESSAASTLGAARSTYMAGSATATHIIVLVQELGVFIVDAASGEFPGHVTLDANRNYHIQEELHAETPEA